MERFLQRCTGVIQVKEQELIAKMELMLESKNGTPDFMATLACLKSLVAAKKALKAVVLFNKNPNFSLREKVDAMVLTAEREL